MSDQRFSCLAALLEGYSKRLKQLLPASEIGFLAPNGTLCWKSGRAADIDKRLLDRIRVSVGSMGGQARIVDPLKLLATFPVLYERQVLGAVLATVTCEAGESGAHAVGRTWRRLRPVLDRLGMDLVEYFRPVLESASLMEGDLGCKEVERLAMLAADIGSTGNDKKKLGRVLAAAVDQLNAAAGALMIPDKNLSLSHASPVHESDIGVCAYRQAGPYLMSYMQRCIAPLIANRLPEARSGWPRCKIIAFPIMLRIDRPVGMVAFFRPHSLPDFSRRHLALVRYVARLIETRLLPPPSPGAASPHESKSSASGTHQLASPSSTDDSGRAPR